MTKKPIFVVTLNTTVLPRARVFGALEDSVHSAFQRHSIFIDKSSPILRSNKKRAWRVVSETSRSVEAFRLELSHNKNTDEEVIKVFEDTVSGLPQNLWDFRIFTSDVHTPVSKQKIYYTGSTRHGLTKKQRLKWDFFFRPDINKLEKEFDDIILKCEEDLSEASKVLSKSTRAIIAYILVLSIYYMISDSGEPSSNIIAVIIVVALSIYLFFSVLNGKLSLNFKKYQKEVKSLELYLKAFNEEKAHVFNELNEIKVSEGKQLDQWKDEEVNAMREEAKGKFVFNEGKKETDTLKGFAIHQPEFINIQKTFSKRITTFYGFRFFQKKLIYSGLYVVFIFQTDEKICISKFFYDFILSKKFREENLEYYYSDLVGVAINSQLVHNPFEDEDQEDAVEYNEVNTIWISFTDSNDIQIAIIDKDTSNSIAQRLIREKDEQSYIDDINFWDDDSQDQLIDDEDLDMNKAYKIVKYIKNRKSSLS